MSRLIALAGLATYVCQTVVNHNGKDHPVGSPIELETEAAQQLLNVQAIAHSEGTNAGGQATMDGVAELLNDLGIRDQKLADARLELQTLQATVDQQRQGAEAARVAAAAELDNLRDQLAVANQKVADLKGVELQLQEQLGAATQQVTDLQAANQALTADLAAAKAAPAAGSTKRTK